MVGTMESPTTRAHINRSGRAHDARAVRATDTDISAVSFHTGWPDPADNRTSAANGIATLPASASVSRRASTAPEP